MDAVVVQLHVVLAFGLERAHGALIRRLLLAVVLLVLLQRNQFAVPLVANFALVFA
mgnify:FL=1